MSNPRLARLWTLLAFSVALFVSTCAVIAITRQTHTVARACPMDALVTAFMVRWAADATPHADPRKASASSHSRTCAAPRALSRPSALAAETVSPLASHRRVTPLKLGVGSVPAGLLAGAARWTV